MDTADYVYLGQIALSLGKESRNISLKIQPTYLMWTPR